jgi:hypothetical protein
LTEGIVDGVNVGVVEGMRVGYGVGPPAGERDGRKVNNFTRSDDKKFESIKKERIRERGEMNQLMN